MTVLHVAQIYCLILQAHQTTKLISDWNGKRSMHKKAINLSSSMNANYVQTRNTY